MSSVGIEYFFQEKELGNASNPPAFFLAKILNFNGYKRHAATNSKPCPRKRVGVGCSGIGNRAPFHGRVGGALAGASLTKKARPKSPGGPFVFTQWSGA